ncbi:hypothetical protein AB4Z22_21325 [Paenibacillus sp. TAF58]
MLFDACYEKFMQLQLQTWSGESQRRLQDGHGHAEKLFLEQVWWPAVGRFDFLHAEYPISDFKDGDRYLDFAYIRGNHLVCIEIDGYKAHHKEINRPAICRPVNSSKPSHSGWVEGAPFRL